MEAWIAILACLVPPSVFGLFPPRTEKWRRARKLYWLSFLIAILIGAVNVYFVDPAGPAGLFYGAWFVFVLVLAAWCYAAAIVRAEWSRWRESRRPKAQPTTAEPESQRSGSPKPWLK